MRSDAESKSAGCIQKQTLSFLSTISCINAYEARKRKSSERKRNGSARKSWSASAGRNARSWKPNGRCWRNGKHSVGAAEEAPQLQSADSWKKRNRQL